MFHLYTILHPLFRSDSQFFTALPELSDRTAYSAPISKHSEEVFADYLLVDTDLLRDLSLCLAFIEVHLYDPALFGRELGLNELPDLLHSLQPQLLLFLRR